MTKISLPKMSGTATARAMTCTWLLFACCGNSILTAQHTQEPAARFVNLSPLEREEWGTATVPFARGAWQPGDVFEPVGAPGELVPFGARWPDGSVRFAQLTTKLRLAPGQDRTVQVRRTMQPSVQQFVMGPWVARQLPNFDFEFVVRTPTGQHTAPLRAHRLIEFSASRLAVHFRDRVPGTDLVYDLWLTLFSGQDHAKFELRLTKSRVGSPNWRQEYDSLGFTVRNAAPFVSHAQYHGIISTPTASPGQTAVMLTGQPSHFYDGQALEWYGHFLFVDPSLPLADANLRIQSLISAVYHQELFGVATNWPASRAFGPFGVVPEAPPWWTDGGLSHNTGERNEFLQFVSQPAATAWDNRPLLLNTHAAATGDQADFGVSQLGDIVRSTLPHRIDQMRFNAGEEAMRPVHFREVDASIVRAENHPDWIVWDGRAHYDNRVSPDRLGKPWPEQWITNEDSHGWTGKDNEHWSTMTVPAVYLLTGSHSLLHEIENEIQLFHASHKTPSERISLTNSIGAPRGVGRVLLSLSWHYLCTGDPSVLSRLERRVDECVLPQYDGFMSTGPVRPLNVFGPDLRAGVNGLWWSPWQESFACAGLAAVAELTGSQTARDLAETSALTVLEHAWQTQGALRVGYAITYYGAGYALTPSQMQDPGFANMTTSAGLFYWTLPSVQIARNAASRAANPALVDYANLIETQIRARRTAPRPGRWDRFGNWATSD